MQNLVLGAAWLLLFKALNPNSFFFIPNVLALCSFPFETVAHKISCAKLTTCSYSLRVKITCFSILIV